MCQKWPKSRFPFVNFIFSHCEIWVQGGASPPPPPTVVSRSTTSLPGDPCGVETLLWLFRLRFPLRQVLWGSLRVHQVHPRHGLGQALKMSNGWPQQSAQRSTTCPGTAVRTGGGGGRNDQIMKMVGLAGGDSLYTVILVCCLPATHCTMMSCPGIHIVHDVARKHPQWWVFLRGGSGCKSTPH